MRVVPAVATFAVDEGFWYSVPETLVPGPSVGSLVRVPLSGRRVGGYVVEVAERPPDRLRPIAGIRGAAPVFDHALLETLRWTAVHYVAPLASVLERAAPPNAPPDAPGAAAEPSPSAAAAGHPLRDVAERAAAGRRHRQVVWLAPAVDGRWLAGLAAPLLAAGRSMAVVVATAAEAEALGGTVRDAGAGPVWVAHGDLDDRAVTDAWAGAHHHGGIVVGTPRVAAWAIRDLVLAVVVEEGRRAMKDRQTPTIHVRELLRSRAAREGVALVWAGPTPTVEVIAGGPDVRRPPGATRAWPLVEVVDRSVDPPGSGLLSEQTRPALASVVNRGGRVFVYAHRRGYAAASRCAACRTLRRCPSCGSRPDPGPVCSRCGAPLGGCEACGGRRFEPLGAGVGRLVEEVGRIVGRDRVEAAPSDRPVVVGTERDLAGLPHVDLAVLVDLDGLAYGSNYRAAEEALRIGARLAGRVAGGTGRRLLVQTSDPGHPVVVALRRGDPVPFLEAEAASRAELGYPPAGALLVVEARRPDDPEAAGARLREIAGAATVLGPAETKDGVRWLVQGTDLDDLRRALRPVVQRWRDAGVTVRIDADPIDL